MIRRFASLLIIGALAAACSKSAPDTQPEPATVGVRMNNTLEAPIARGDCKEATRRAVLNPEMDVERVAAPLGNPSPLTGKIPKGATDRNGWYNIKFHVLVDAAGKPDMKTFVVDTTTHAWFASSVKTAVAKWTFSPAEVAGCKIPRNYSLGFSPRGKTPAVATKPAAKTPAKPAAKKPPVA